MRLDQLLVKTGKFKSRDRAKEAIEKGEIKVGGKVISKPSFNLTEDTGIELLQEDFGYVSRGGLKLQGALENFGIEVSGLVALDIGVATGGFSDCLLQKKAAKVYAVDIGEGQIDQNLLKDPRLIFRNKTDARDLKSTDFEEKLDLIVIDVSFISILNLLDSLNRIVTSETKIIALIKPQFELGKAHGGVIKDQKIVQEILVKVKKRFEEAGYNLLAEMPSPILGKEGNREFLWLIKKS